MAEDLFKHPVVPSATTITNATLPSGKGNATTSSNLTSSIPLIFDFVNENPGTEREAQQGDHGEDDGHDSHSTAKIALEDGEIMETEFAPTLENRELQTKVSTEVTKPHKEQSCEFDATWRTTRGKNNRKSSKTCFFWYHFKTCDRDPADPKKPGKLCPYVHSLDAVTAETKLASVPKWMHKQEPCGLELCPWKDKEWKPKDKSEMKDTTLTRSKAGLQLAISFDSSSGSKAVQSSINKKRKFRHQDEPALRATKCPKIDYDEDDDADCTSQEQKETCFFWYHGHCLRSLDRRVNYQCDYKHQLTDPLVVAYPPPGYVHHKPCGLGYCPGDGLSSSRAAKIPTRRRALQAQETGTDLRARDSPTEKIVIHENSSEPEYRRESVSEGRKTGRTCFFWYHGTCKRTKDARRKFECSMKHELDDPPSMVEPPPGYAHKVPCGLEWCPGDAAQHEDGVERYFESRERQRRTMKQDKDIAGDVEGHGSDHAESSPGCPQREDWYLSGFDDNE